MSASGGSAPAPSPTAAPSRPRPAPLPRSGTASHHPRPGRTTISRHASSPTPQTSPRSSRRLGGGRNRPLRVPVVPRAVHYRARLTLGDRRDERTHHAVVGSTLGPMWNRASTSNLVLSLVAFLFFMWVVDLAVGF